MAIVKMKRLRLLGIREEREELLRALQRLGCVEVDQPAIDPDDPAWAALTRPEGKDLAAAKEESALLSRALAVLNKYAPAKSGLLQARPEVSEAGFFDDAAYASGLQAAQAIVEAEKTLAAHQAEIGKIATQKASLAPWLSLDVPLDYVGGEHFSVLFGAVPLRADFSAAEAAVGAASELAQLIPAGCDRELRYFLLVCHKSVEADCTEALRGFGYSQGNLRGWTGSAVDNDRRLEGELSALARQVEQDRAAVAAFGDKRPLLRQTLDRASQEVSRAEAKGRLIDTEETFCLDGWFPAEDEAKLSALLDGYTCAWEAAEPAEEEYPRVPVKLKNNVVTRSMNTITEMYSMPAYDGVDANPLMAPFFIVIYGFMMADMAYGLLMMLGAGIYLKKTRPKNPYFMEMIFWCGISSFVVGAMTGGFFGDFIPQLLSLFGVSFTMPALFTPMEDTLAIMIGSIALGFVQIVVGMAVSVWYKTQNGNFLDALFDEITWWIILAGLAVWLCGGMFAILPSVFGTVGLVMLIVGALMLVFGGTRNAKGFGKVTSLVGIIYNGVTGFFSDALSYVRIMALMLSGSVIASVFNTLGSTFGNVVLFVVISLVGNALNFALNLLGCYVHDLRLQCLEFFGRFYKEGGRPYRPLSIQTTYVDIIKEEN